MRLLDAFESPAERSHRRENSHAQPIEDPTISRRALYVGFDPPSQVLQNVMSRRYLCDISKPHLRADGVRVSNPSVFDRPSVRRDIHEVSDSDSKGLEVVQEIVIREKSGASARPVCAQLVRSFAGVK